MRKLALSLLMVGMLAGTARAITSGFDSTVLSGDMDGYVTNVWNVNLGIANWLSAELLINLDSGSIYQEPAPWGGDGPPDPMYFMASPSLQFDTYLTGGADSVPGGAQGTAPYIMGGAVDVGGQATATFNTEDVDVTWFDYDFVMPSGSLALGRFTLSDDATGTFNYRLGFGPLGENPDSAYAFGGTISNGAISAPNNWMVDLAGEDICSVAIKDGNHEIDNLTCKENLSLTRSASNTDLTSIAVNGEMVVTDGASVSVTGIGRIAVGGADVSTVSAGTLLLADGGTLGGGGTISGSVVAEGGSINPGQSPGTLHLSELEMQAGSTLNLEIGPESDLLDVAGDASLGGTISLLFEDGFAVEDGDSFVVVSAGGTLNASGATFQVSNAPAGYACDASVEGNDLVVTVAAVPEPTALVALAGLLLLAPLARKRR